MNKHKIQNIKHNRSRSYMESIYITNPNVEREVAVGALFNMLANESTNAVILRQKDITDLINNLFEIFEDGDNT